MAYSILNTLPVELFHHLLNYFSAHEIFYTFTNVNPYIDGILRTYASYCVNFKSIAKKEFDLVCQRIIPNQVISLTLSDNEQTPGQLELFLSRFQIDQFTRLRSLTLIDVGPDYWEAIVTKLSDLKYLRSFFYDSSNRSDSWISKIPFSAVTALDKELFKSYGPVLPQLHRLKLSHGDFLTSVSFPYLRHLIIRDCKVEIIEQISSAAPQLKALDTLIRLDQSITCYSFTFNQLRQLVLRIEGTNVTMDDMKQLLAKVPNLKYLELHANGSGTLIDGQRWQTITSHLITFNFRFSVPYGIDMQDLDSFRTSFWLEEKRWFVAYTDRLFFSVPRFAETDVNEEFRLPVLTTLPDINVFYNHVNHLTLTDSAVSVKHRFPQVETLSISNYLQLLFVEQIVDLNRVKQLSLYSLADDIDILFLLKNMPNVYRISIPARFASSPERILPASFTSIRHLDIGTSYSSGDNDDDNNNYDIEQLSSVFPSVEHLNVAHLCSKNQIINFINEFKHLLTASFHCISWFTNTHQANEHITSIQLALVQNRFSHKSDYTYRFSRSSVCIWL